LSSSILAITTRHKIRTVVSEGAERYGESAEKELGRIQEALSPAFPELPNAHRNMARGCLVTQRQHHKVLSQPFLGALAVVDVAG
jgi:hypothetical protein